MRLGIFTDPHYSSAQVTCGKRYNSRSLEKIREAMSFFEKENCYLAICLGDLIDQEKDRALIFENLKRVANVFRQSRLRVICLMGNHDAVSLSRDEFYAVLGEECRPEMMSFNQKTLLFADACYTSDGHPYSPFDGQYDWRDTFLPRVEELKRQIHEAQGDVYLFIHQNIDPEVREDHRISNDRQVRNILEASGKVKAVYQGHFHPGHAARSGGIEYVTFPAMCEQENARFVLEI